jgi:carbonic anhydrase
MLIMRGFGKYILASAFTIALTAAPAIVSTPYADGGKEPGKKGAHKATEMMGASGHGAAAASHGKADAHSAPHWTYKGAGGPGQWGSMSPDFAACSQGKKQSPIDITDAFDYDLSEIEFNYAPSKLSIVNNGHTVQVNFGPGSTIKIGFRTYDLLQFHFHTPSEHTVGGKSFDGELHLVHRNSHGMLAVVGVFIKKGAANSAFDSVIANIPKHGGDKKESSATVDPAKLLPKSRNYYTYNGSLTTPPCTEGVRWLVLQEPVTMSKAQIDALESVMGHNSRPVQPLNMRLLRGDFK